MSDSITPKKSLSQFEVVLYAAYRASQLSRGAPAAISGMEGRKTTAIAIAEIQSGLVDIEKIREGMIQELVESRWFLKKKDPVDVKREIAKKRNDTMIQEMVDDLFNEKFEDALLSSENEDEQED
ncbi:DNA-directed RNA polymerase subunit omega [Candidatus Fokinia solitaria]|uniref:DNA-directed RNA polymerase subunit omega n=1 Tax=Candidatus Fokinia solitaria TaxID=1802984 RepID=A0A2U8BRR7_9RICK|nr:DNA-directed RNA polymerase subunit omega [Candidatus Fokinia solitaria]AWD33046.1 DNA-directed RNA polymerase subunit omega [Candidatus Fokinia solitaria]